MFTNFRVMYADGETAHVTLTRFLTKEEVEQLGYFVSSTDPLLIKQIIGHSAVSIKAVKVVYTDITLDEVMLTNTGKTARAYEEISMKDAVDEIKRLFPGDAFFIEDQLPPHLRSRYHDYARLIWDGDLKKKEILRRMFKEIGPMTQKNCPSLLQRWWKPVLREHWEGLSPICCSKCQKRLYNKSGFGHFCNSFEEEGVVRKRCPGCPE